MKLSGEFSHHFTSKESMGFQKEGGLRVFQHRKRPKPLNMSKRTSRFLRETITFQKVVKPVDASETRRDNQLRLVVEIPLFYKGFIHPRWFFGISEPSTVLQVDMRV